MTETEWLSELLIHGKARYLGSSVRTVVMIGNNIAYQSNPRSLWVCEQHPLLPCFGGKTGLECTCKALGASPLSLPPFVNGFNCSLPDYFIKVDYIVEGE